MAGGKELFYMLVLRRVMISSFESPRELQSLVDPGRN